MSIPQIIIIGNLAEDVKSGTSQSGTSWAKFTVMTANRRKDQQSGQWVDGDKSVKRCVVFGTLAQHVTQTYTKGMQVIVIGRERDVTWQDQNGNTRYGTEVIVDATGPSLQFATAQVVKQQKQGQTQQQGSWADRQYENMANQQQFAPSTTDPWASTSYGGGYVGNAEEPEF